MNYILYIICLFSFLLLPPLALVLRYVKKELVPWLLFFIILALFSWICTNGAVYFYYEHLTDVISQYGDNCPQELLDRQAAKETKIQEWQTELNRLNQLIGNAIQEGDMQTIEFNKFELEKASKMYKNEVANLEAINQLLLKC